MVTDDSYESSRLDHDCGQGESSTNDDDISMGCCCDSSRVSASSTAADANDLVGVDDDDEGGSGGDGGEDGHGRGDDVNDARRTHETPRRRHHRHHDEPRRFPASKPIFAATSPASKPIFAQKRTQRLSAPKDVTLCPPRTPLSAPYSTPDKNPLSSDVGPRSPGDRTPGVSRLAETSVTRRSSLWLYPHFRRVAPPCACGRLGGEHARRGSRGGGRQPARSAPE